jgi:hypothetical protein
MHLIKDKGVKLKDISVKDILFFPNRKTAERVVEIDDFGIYTNRFFKNNSERFEGLPYVQQRIFYESGDTYIMHSETGGETIESTARAQNEEIRNFERNINDMGIVLGEYK